jgi:hypothetical protein
MKFQEIQKTATRMNLPAYRVKKTDLIRSIQRAEGNFDCYGTDRIETCEEHACLWKKDCFALHHKS